MDNLINLTQRREVIMDNLINLTQRREAAIVHMNGPARCLHCGHTWEARVPEGTIMSLECPSCGLFKGVLEGLMEPGQGTRFVCQCGSDLFYILPDGCQCLLCGVMATGL